MADRSAALEFDPSWIYDPVPWWLVRELDREILVQLATVKLQYQKSVLESQLKATQQSLDIVAKAGRHG